MKQIIMIVIIGAAIFGVSLGLVIISERVFYDGVEGIDYEHFGKMMEEKTKYEFNKNSIPYQEIKYNVYDDGITVTMASCEDLDNNTAKIKEMNIKRLQFTCDELK